MEKKPGTPRSHFWIVGIAAIVVLCFSPLGMVAVMGLSFLGMGDGDRYDRFKENGNYDGGRFSTLPDGATLLTSSPRTGRGDLYAVSLISKQPPKRLTSTPNCDLNPVSSPDGKQIVFVRQGLSTRPLRSGTGTSSNDSLFIMDADGSHAHPLLANARYVIGYAFPVFSPDNKFVYVCRVSHPPSAFLANPSEWVRIDIITGQTVPLSADWRNEPTFSPDGKTVYYTATTGGRGDTKQARQDSLYAAPAPRGTSAEQRSHRFAVNAYDPCVSPDGTRLVYISYAGENPAVCCMEANGKNVRVLWSPVRHFPAQPQWEASGKSILFHESPDVGPDKITRLFMDTGKTETVATE